MIHRNSYPPFWAEFIEVLCQTHPKKTHILPKTRPLITHNIS